MITMSFTYCLPLTAPEVWPAPGRNIPQA